MLWKNVQLFMLFWTLVIVASAFWNLYSQRQGIKANLYSQAAAVHGMEMEYRNWVIQNGGVYVPVSDKIRPSPWLSHVPERDIRTPSGKQLTLLNSSYVVRLVHENMRTSGSTLRDHIASLKPINPANAADKWERRALESFERGAKESASFDVLEDGKTYYRYMKPMVAEESCLKCHARHGVKLGDIRGGVSVAIPVDVVMSAGRNERNAMIAGHGLIWGLGLIGLFVGGRKQQQAMQAVERSEETLLANEERLHLATTAGNIGIWDWDVVRNELAWDESMYSLYGIRKEDFGGAYDAWSRTLHPDDHQFVEEEIQAALHGEREYAPEFRIVRPDGTVRDIKAASRTYYDAQGKSIRMVGTNIDITDRKKSEGAARAASQYARSLIEASLDPLVTISAEGKITDVNRATEKATGRSRGELIGTDFSDYFTEPDKARAGYQQVFAQGFVTDYPLALRHRDGHVADVLYNASVYRDEAGAVLGVFAAARDVTELRRAEVTRTQLAAIVESSNDAIIGKTPDGIITSWNKGAETVYGYTAEEIVGKHVTALVPPERHAEIRTILETVRKGGAVAHHESERIRKDGRVIQVALTLSPIRDASGAIIGISTIARDITEKKRMEEELRRANVYNRSLIEASLDPLVTISAEGKITDVNQATEKITGRTRAELIGTDFSDYFTEPDKARAGYRQVFAQGFVTDYPLALRHRDGHVADVLYNASVYRDEAGAVLGVFAAARDVTERKKAEQEVAHLSLQNKLILDSAGEGIYGLGLDGRCTFVNPSAVQLLGFSAEELVGEHAHNRFHHTRPDGRPYPEEECPVQMAYRQGEVHRGDDLYWRKDGSSFPVEFISTSILDAGRITGAVVTFRDITERKLAEEHLRRSERSLAEAQRIAHLGNWELDLVHNVLRWSDEIYRIFEIDPEKFGASYEAFLNAIHPDDRDMVNKAYTDSVANRVPYDIVHRLRMQDGRIKYVNEMCETYYGEDGKPLRSVGTVHDITERKLAEDEVKALNRDLEQRVIMRTAELEAANKELEAFSYSVSHDLRTPLRAIDGFSRIVLDDYRERLDDEGKRLLNVVRDNTIRMGQLIDDILKFSRAGRTEIAYSEIDMEQMARAVSEELRPPAAGDRLQIEIEHLPPARGDSAMMRQVFVNLLSNAVKFSRTKEPARITVGGSIEGDEAVYFVRDNGAGFDMQYAGRLFGVFQRLHDVNEFEGTGIGLAIVKRIITRHGGRVWAEGKVNEGATVYFALPGKGREHA